VYTRTWLCMLSIFAKKTERICFQMGGNLQLDIQESLNYIPIFGGSNTGNFEGFPLNSALFGVVA